MNLQKHLLVKLYFENFNKITMLAQNVLQEKVDNYVNNYQTR